MELIPEHIEFSKSSFSSRTQQQATKYFMEQYIRDPPHSLEITMVGSSVTDATCTCKAGLAASCSHVLALLKYLQFLKISGLHEIPSDLPCTSMPQVWHMPRGEKITPVAVTSIVAAKPRTDRKHDPSLPSSSKHESLEPSFLAEVAKLKELKGTPLEYIACSQPPLVKGEHGIVPLGSVACYQGIGSGSWSNERRGDGCNVIPLPGKSIITIPLEYSHLKQYKHISEEEAMTLEKNTRQQTSSKLWIKERQHRLTASQFGLILKRKSAPTQIFLDSLFNPRNIQVNSVKYGRANESFARQKYCKLKSLHSHQCGLLVNPEFPFLGATPDAKICGNGEFGLMEVKCPYTARDMTVRDRCHLPE